MKSINKYNNVSSFKVTNDGKSIKIAWVDNSYDNDKLWMRLSLQKYLWSEIYFRI